jgi:hypothetical protein
MSSWIQTYTDRAFDPVHPVASAVHLEDIAQSLSLQCRFAGHVQEHYSVAQHSVLVFRLVESWTSSTTAQIQALLHDASEAYLVDVPAPLKQTALGRIYYDYERRVANVIGTRFGVSLDPIPRVVRTADAIMLATERRDLKGPAPAPGGWPDVEPLPERVTPWPAATAKREFLAACRALDVA